MLTRVQIKKQIRVYRELVANDMYDSEAMKSFINQAEYTLDNCVVSDEIGELWERVDTLGEKEYILQSFDILLSDC